MTIPPADPPGQTIETPADAWAYFDRVYCISLRERTDRRQSAAKELSKAGVVDRVTFWLVDKNPAGSEQGIYESHQACLRDGLSAGAERIVVFEDDVLIRHFRERTLREATAFLRSHEAWQMFFFGGFVRSSKSTDSPSVRSIRYRCAAHAYVVTRSLAERIVAAPWNGTAYDDLLRQLDADHYYMACPAFAFQSNSPTDNNQRQGTDRARRLVGGLYFGQRWDEFSHQNWRMMIVMHLLCIAVIVTIVLVVRRVW